ncbi:MULTISPECIES: hypothetical protein [unclassified Collinsella]|uniref:hypothetical protein n=1 Tax=unclassified Collinsella TaxID=2637548 RepID=UPI001F03A3C2|nr:MULTISPECIES: hypothetical protein [unclassified Collinsella]
MLERVGSAELVVVALNDKLQVIRQNKGQATGKLTAKLLRREAGNVARGEQDVVGKGPTISCRLSGTL